MKLKKYYVFPSRSPEVVVDPSKKRVRSRPLSDFFSNRNGFGSDNLEDVCGAIGFSQKIIGGELTELDEYPWTALLIYGPESNKLFLNQ